MLGKKRNKNKTKDDNNHKNKIQIINTEKNNITDKKTLIKNNKEIKNNSLLNTNINNNNKNNINEDEKPLITNNIINEKNENAYKAIGEKHHKHLGSYSKLNYKQIKQKFKQIDNNYDENNISILDNIDRLTSVLSGIMVAQNEQKAEKNENFETKEKFDDNIDNIEQYESINPLIIDANNDRYLNYLLNLNDNFKKKINDDFKFDELYQFFTNYTIQKIEYFMNNLIENKNIN